MIVGASRASRISARTPATIAVSPTRITADPWAWVSEDVLRFGVRGVEGEREEGRVGGADERWAWR